MRRAWAALVMSAPPWQALRGGWEAGQETSASTRWLWYSREACRGHQPVIVPFGDDDLRVGRLLHGDVAGFEFQRHPRYRGEVPADCLTPVQTCRCGQTEGYSTSASGAYNSSGACHPLSAILLIRSSKTSRGLRIGPVFI